MAETALAANVTTSLTDPKATAATLGGTPVAVDTANGNSFANTGRQVLLVDNTGASSRTVAVRDKNGAAVATLTVAANKCQAIGPFDVSIFGETVAFTGNHAELEVRVFSLTGGGLTNVLTAR